MQNFNELVPEFHNLIFNHLEEKKYPWRYIDDPYSILISEFMLHRTQVHQVIPVYESFITAYPDIESFVHEHDSILLDALKSLGLLWRQTGMILAIRELYSTYHSVLAEYESLISIKGIGPYIAGAVVCFSKNEAIPLIDTNTVRVIGRVFGLRLDGEARRRKEMVETIKITTPSINPRKYYYSIIDHAHSTCLPSKPGCDACLLRHICQFRITLNLSGM